MRVHEISLLIACFLLAGCATHPAGDDADVPRVEPFVTVSVDAPSPGDELWVEAGGFPPRARLEIGAGPVASEYEVLTRVETGEDGHAETVARLPAGAEPGRDWVVVARVSETGIKAVSEAFRVAGGAGRSTATQVMGILTDEGVECQALRSDKGLLYTLAGDLGDARPGDRVRVVGTPAEMSTCMQGTTLQVQSLEVLSDSLRESE